MTGKPVRVRPGTASDILISDGIRAAAARTPDKVAIIEGERRLTYRAITSRISNERLMSSGMMP